MFKRFVVALFVMLLVIGTGLQVYGQAATATPTTPEVTASATPAPTAPPVTCFVSTDTARSATVRVGPGTNRTALLFLSVDESYSVVGVNRLADESVWFKLIKDEVDPGSGAAELWVAAEDVEQEGDCENVGVTVAPPIVPILNSAAAASAEVTKPVTGGAWQIYFADKFIYSCVTPSFVTSTREDNTLTIMDKLDWAIELVFASNQRSFSMTGEWVEYSVDEGASVDFVLTADNLFTAAATQPNGRNFVYNVTAITADLLAGETRFHFGNSSVQCSETIKFEMRRR